VTTACAVDVRPTMIAATLVLCALSGVVDSQTTGGVTAPLPPFSLGKLFTFLFLTLGPFKIIGPFVQMTHGRDAAFKRELALRGTIVAAIGLLAAATVGANTLVKWGVSVGALQLTAGIILFLVALRQVMEQYGSREAAEPAASAAAVAPVPASKLAVLLAFPTIVTPWGVALVIMAMTLREGYALQILAATAVVLVVNFLVMMVAERILKAPAIVAVLAIVGTVLGILQVALGVQVMAAALPMLGLAGDVNG
jgi:multiple antibiotic resistance protein